MPNKVIAIIDDEPHLVEMITAFLTLKGYDVRSAYTGEQGLALVQTDRPDALLLDLMLPDIAGFEVCARLRAMDEFADLPILIVSARTDPTSKTRAEQAGATLYLTKPVAMPHLVAAIEKVLAG